MHAFFFVLLSLYFYSVHTPARQVVEKPNILLIMVDDMGYGDIGMSGNEDIRTPNLDEIARKSVSFEHFYVSPVCAPTRASLLTGRYHQRTGVRSVTNGYETIAPDEKLLSEYLSEAGYKTGIFGKWHLGEYYPSLPLAQGFDEFLGFRTGHTADYFDAELEHNGKVAQTKGYITDALTNAAWDFMATSDKPFFCYLPYNAPHTPLQVPDSLYLPYMQQGLEEREARIYAMMENIDSNMGQLLQKLENSDKLKNTIVIFLSDNGPINGWRIPQEEMRYNAGLRNQKFTIYEGGIRTQCFWYWKDKWSPKRTEQLAAHIDLLPTLLDILNIPLSTDKKIDGISLLPVLQKNETIERQLFMNYSLETLREPAPYPGGILRTANYKMVNGNELYHLPSDHGEQHNIAEKQPELLAEMDSTYRSWWAEVNQERGFQLLPIPIGFAKENPVKLMPHSGRTTGELQFMGHKGLLGERIASHPSGVDGDWITNWKKPGDEITWEIDVQQAGTYQVLFYAQGHAKDLQFKLSTKGVSKMLDVTVSDAEQWKDYEVAQLKLAAGKQTLTLELVEAAKGDVAIAYVGLEKQ